MHDFNNVQAAALAAGATLAGGGFVGIHAAYRRRSPAGAKAARVAKAQQRLDATMRRGIAPTPQPGPEPVRAAVAVARPERADKGAVRAAVVHDESLDESLDVGTLEELLAGLFSLRNDLSTLASELHTLREGRETTKVAGAA